MSCLIWCVHIHEETWASCPPAVSQKPERGFQQRIRWYTISDTQSSKDTLSRRTRGYFGSLSRMEHSFWKGKGGWVCCIIMSASGVLHKAYAWMCRYGFLCVYSVCVGVCVCDRESVRFFFLSAHHLLFKLSAKFRHLPVFSPPAHPLAGVPFRQTSDAKESGRTSIHGHARILHHHSTS